MSVRRDTENHLEIVLEMRKSAGERILAGVRGPITGFPAPTTAWVAEHRIGLIDQLETLFGNRVIAVEIWMPTPGFLPEGMLLLWLLPGSSPSRDQ